MLLNATDLFRPYLLSNERIMWSGQLKQGLLFGARDALLIPFSLMWGGFAVFWNLAVWTLVPETGQHVDWFFRLWGMPFLAAGLYITIGRFWHDAWLRRRLYYAVTDQRVLVLRGAKARAITSLDLHRLPRLELSEQRDGTGTIGFETNAPFSGRSMNGFGWWVPALGGTTQFFRIDQPRSVYELIRKQAQG